ncbi:MAG: NAD(P)H-dependent oxidoreductase subunit E [Thermodesulfovibrionales bacterium]|nr:NAD(P)H-dependent oxidoreductase subunit E [Thermodesulfovibrionales bacterium]
MKVEEIDVNGQIGRIGKILDEREKKRGILIQTLQQIQSALGYLPEESVRQLSQKLKLSMSEIFSVASFYRMFYFKPRGKKIVKVCLGTACYVRGSKKVLNALEQEFNIKNGETTEDLALTLETVGCVGCCGLAPVTTINENVLGEITGSGKLRGIIQSIREK